MDRFYPPEKLVYTYLLKPQLIEWDYDKLALRYYSPTRLVPVEKIRQKWEWENARIIKGHANKLRAINKVIDKCRKVGCHIDTEPYQATCIDWDAYIPGMEEAPTKNCGPLMHRVTITRKGW